MNGWMSGILMLWNMGIVAGLMLGGSWCCATSGITSACITAG